MFDKNHSSIGTITMTGGKTSIWFKDNLVSDGMFFKYGDELQAPLNWRCKLLIICGHGKPHGNSIKGSNTKLSVEDLAEFIRNNVTYEKILLNMCSAGNSGDNPGESFGNTLSKALNCRVYAAYEKIKAHSGKSEKFFNQEPYTFHRYYNNTKSKLGSKTLEDMVNHIVSRP